MLCRWSLSVVGALVILCLVLCFFFKQKTAYEMRISDWSSDVCSSDLHEERRHPIRPLGQENGAVILVRLHSPDTASDNDAGALGRRKPSLESRLGDRKSVV